MSISVLYDCIIYELQNAGGISVYWSELASRIRKSDHRVSFFGKENSNIFSGDLDYEREGYCRYFPRRYLPFYPSDSSSVNDKHIFHSSYFRYSNYKNSINVTTVHDFTYEKYFHGPKLWMHAYQKKLAVSKSDGIICVSENTRKDLLGYYPWVDPDSVKVIYNGVGDSFRPIKADASARLEDELRFFSNRPFMLYVGDRSSYKNFDKFVALADHFPEMDLVVVGGAQFTKNEIQISKKVSHRIYHFRGISDESLNLLYNSAWCLVYPSSYEGFGIPVLEAMRAGCPVVTTNLSSIPEVVSDSALLVDQPTVKDLSVQVQRLFSREFRFMIRKKGLEQSQRFSWDKCYESTICFYEELWNKHSK